MTKQQLARDRNWIKARFVGTVAGINREALQPGELELLNKIIELRDRLIMNWDSNSAAMGLHIRQHKCDLCGRRMDNPKLRQLGDETLTLCPKHAKEYDKDEV